MVVEYDCQGFARQHLDSDGTKKTRSPQTRQSKAIKSTPARASRGNIWKVEVEPELEVEESARWNVELRK